MKYKALVIQDGQNQSFDYDGFMATRNLVAEYCSTGSGALTAFKTERYRCVVVSMEMEREDPLEIIRELRCTEQALGLSPTQILVLGRMRQPTQAEIMKLKISGLIRSHQLS